MYKCKPSIIEQIHWNVGAISSFGIYTTCINALEDIDVLNYDNILPYLLEEYELDHIIHLKDVIDRIIKEINTKIVFTERVLSKYNELRIPSTEKGIIMRSLSPFFSILRNAGK